MAEGNSGESVLAFLLGGVIGGILGILLAPRKGEETRELLADWLEENRDKTKRFLKKENDFIAEKKKRVTAAWEAGKKVFTEGEGSEEA